MTSYCPIHQYNINIRLINMLFYPLSPTLLFYGNKYKASKYLLCPPFENNEISFFMQEYFSCLTPPHLRLSEQ